MNLTTDVTSRPTLSLSFDRKVQRHSNPFPMATLSRTELKRIVAEMVG